MDYYTETTEQKDYFVQENSQDIEDFEPELPKPVITYILIALNVLVWLALKIISFTSGKSYYDLLTVFGEKNNALILKGEYWRFFTPMLLHGGIVHLASNCYGLYYLGRQAEILYGRIKFLIIYVFSGFLGCVASFAF